MPVKPSIRLNSLPNAIPLPERFAMARAAGFEGVELEVGSAPAAELRAAADAAGMSINSIYCAANYSHPLSSPDRAVRDAGAKAVVAAIETGAALGAGVLLLIPGLLRAEATHGEAWRRSQEVIRSDILPEAERNKVVIGIENIWPGFLQGPVEHARYVDELASPFAGAYLDVGNVIFGKPEGWIEVLGERIVQLHIKDSYFDDNFGRCGFRRIGEGEIDWRRVRDALRRTGFSGWGVLAEVEKVQRPAIVKAWDLLRRAPRRIGPNPAVALAQRWIARRTLADSMTRFRRYVG